MHVIPRLSLRAYDLLGDGDIVWTQGSRLDREPLVTSR